MNQEGSSATTNAILVILLVIVVGFVVWYMTIRTTPAEQDESAGIQLNIGGSSSNEDDNSPNPN